MFIMLTLIRLNGYVMVKFWISFEYVLCMFLDMLLVCGGLGLCMVGSVLRMFWTGSCYGVVYVLGMLFVCVG